MIRPLFSTLAALGFVNGAFSYLSGDDISSSDGILNLDRSNFKKAISQHDYLMVKFYLPSCPHCQYFEPEYLKVKKLLGPQNSYIVLAQVNAQENKPLAEQFQIKGYPALRLFRKGEIMDYYGKRNAEDIAAWLKRMCSF